MKALNFIQTRVVQSKRDEQYLLVCLLTGLFSLTTIAFILGPGDGVIGVLWSLMLITIILPVLFSPKLRRNPFHPYSYLTVYVLVYYAFGSLSILFGWGLPYTGPLQHFAEAAALISICLLLLWYGFRSRLGVILARFFPLFVFKKSGISKEIELYLLRSAIILYFLGWTGRISKLAVGYTHLPTDIGASFQFLPILQMFSLFGRLAFITILYLTFSSHRKNLRMYIMAIVLFLLEILAGALEGGRTAILMPFLLGVIVFHYSIRPFSWKQLGIAFLILLTLLAPLTTIYRALYYDLLSQGELSLSNFVAMLRRFPYKILNSSKRWYDTVAPIFSRFTTLFDGTLRVLNRVPELFEFQKGGTFLPDLFTVLVPRVIWPKKPIYNQGRQFAVLFWDRPKGKFGTSTGIGLPAELYFNFGWFGVLLIPLWGIIIRFFWERFRYYARKEKIPIVRLVFTLFVASSVLGNIFGFWAGTLRTSIMYYIFLILLYRQFPSIIFLRAK